METIPSTSIRSRIIALNLAWAQTSDLHLEKVMGGAGCLCSSPSPSLGFGAGSQLDGSAARSWFKRRQGWRAVKIRRSTQVEQAELTDTSNPSSYYSTASSSVEALASHGTLPNVAGATGEGRQGLRGEVEGLRRVRYGISFRCGGKRHSSTAKLPCSPSSLLTRGSLIIVTIFGAGGDYTFSICSMFTMIWYPMTALALPNAPPAWPRKAKVQLQGIGVTRIYDPRA
ncbi:hypothetical protein DFP72DRAFT_1042339 [Ephemerocybe angulata]|uniref:Uncharacterized protein n=1 Tax=Ephemerocybe angulata TaxID=980116 RepID=A0A8H6I8G5_9AGAR|nr:hypothetical protein DFP72DRAFT_1042339 [Tulosesus angulatus]